MKHPSRIIRAGNTLAILLLALLAAGCDSSSNTSTDAGSNGSTVAEITAFSLTPLTEEKRGYLRLAWEGQTNADDNYWTLAMDEDGLSEAVVVAGAGQLPAATRAFDLKLDLPKFDPATMASRTYYLTLYTASGGFLQETSLQVGELDVNTFINYLKASNTDAEDSFGNNISLAADGNTLAVGAPYEGSNATGVNGDATNNSAVASGAVYLFVRDAGVWTQQAYLKASNTGAGDQFGFSVSLADDGNTLAVGAIHEDSNATGVNGDATDNSASNAGAVYLLGRDAAGAWTQQAYLKASNTGANDQFGFSVSLAADGHTLAVGAIGEASNTTGVNGDQADNSVSSAGAVYLFVRDAADAWTQQAYLKASNTGASDQFGFSVSLAADGHTLAVGAPLEASNATGVNGDQANNSASSAGAVYLFVRDAADAWTQQAYIKASNTDANDQFGFSISLAADGHTLAVGASGEASNAAGINGDQADNSVISAGAVYVFTRDAGSWSQRTYLKTSNTYHGSTLFGRSVSLAADAATLAVGAPYESNNATGINADVEDYSAMYSGAVYIY